MIGGVLIAAYRVETGEFHAEEIPVALFQGQRFAHRDYLRVSADCAAKCLDTIRAGAPPCNAKEPIHICSGFIHAETHRRHPSFKIIKVEGPFQDRIEKELLDHLNKLGFPYKGSTEEYGKLFFEAVRWLKGGNPNRRGMDPERVKLGKTGWATWEIYQKHPYKEATHLAKEFKRRLALERRGRRGGSWDGED